ncbi:MAG: FliH/SctL family protein [Bythopirellula sp.]
MATIIKRESQRHASGTELRKVAYDLNDLASEGDAYLQQIRAEAAKIVQQAEQDAATIRQQAEVAGKQAAEAAIERILDDKVAKQMQTLTPALSAAVQQIEDSRQDWLRNWESSATQLACAIAAKIVRRELKSQPGIALEWIREALQMCAGAAEITLRLHPDDFETLGEQVRQLTEVFHPVGAAKIVADPAITSCGCRLETEFGSIDQQLETQLERLQQELS